MAPYRIFFSHGGDDEFIVKEFLRPRVESSGATIFLDAGRIEYGEDFRATIFAELAGCDELLVLLTPSSLKRPWVIAEIGAVLVRGKRVVVIRYGPSEGELQALGILSLLGSISLLRMEDIDRYVEQLTRRVAEHCHA
jgi:TIR domain